MLDQRLGLMKWQTVIAAELVAKGEPSHKRLFEWIQFTIKTSESCLFTTCVIELKMIGILIDERYKTFDQGPKIIFSPNMGKVWLLL